MHCRKDDDLGATVQFDVTIFFIYFVGERQKCKRGNQSTKESGTFSTSTYGALLFNFIFLFLLLMLLAFLGLILEISYMPLSSCHPINNSLKAFDSAGTKDVNRIPNEFVEYVNLKTIIGSPQVFPHFVINR